MVLAELLELSPGGLEEVALADGRTEYALYGAPGELPSLPLLQVAIGGALVEVDAGEVPDDWEQRWRRFHRPLVLGSRLTIRPPWEPGGATDLDLVIDPGLAFGTGSHATTRLCLELMLELPAGGSFLDLGCGSGVLAIAAVRLGYDAVLAVDNDPAAIEATRSNAQRNGVRLQATLLDLRRGAPPPAATVAANLLRPLLLSLAPHLAAGTERLIASGVLIREADEVAAAFAAAGLFELARRTDGDWAALLVGRRPGALRCPPVRAGDRQARRQPREEPSRCP